MKKLFLSFLIILSLIIPTFAITIDQLNQAEDILRQMDSKISQLREYVQIARDGKIRDITLTATQRQELQNKYLAEKAELVTLYNQLP